MFICPHCQTEISLEPGEEKRDACPHCGASLGEELAPTMVFSAKSKPRLGKFELLEEVGRGSFGTVYRARDTELDRIVAVKVPRSTEILQEEDEERFLREGRTAAQLRHSGIVPVFEVGRADSTPYIVTEFVHGVTLSDALSGPGFTHREAAELVELIADALDSAHRQGVIHRDLKPSNILLEETHDATGTGSSRQSGSSVSGLARANGSTRQGAHGSTRSGSGSRRPGPSLRFVPRIMDFGLARREGGEATFTVAGDILGTPRYMSPEQARGEGHTADGRADIYSAGMVLYELLVGEVPFRGNARMLLHQVLHDEPQAPRKLDDSIPLDLETITLKCLAKEPERRYATGADLATDLALWLSGEPIHARPVGRVERLWRRGRRNRAGAGSPAVVAPLLLLVAVGATIAAVAFRDSAGRERKARDEALLSAIRESNAATQAREARDEADSERKKVGVLLDDSRRQLVQTYLNNGMRAIDDDDLPASLPWFTAALRLDHEDGQPEETHRIRIGSVLRQCPQLVELLIHKDMVTHVAFSPDGTRLLTASADTTARVWNADTGEPVTPVLSHVGGIRHAAFSDDGRMLAIGSARTVRIWNAETGQEIGNPLQHGGPVNHVEFDADGHRLATACADKLARVWDLSVDPPVAIEVAHEEEVYRVSISPDGERFATASRDSKARVWNSATGEPVTPELAHNDRVYWVGFSPDGERVVTASYDFTARVWDAQTGKPMAPALQHEADVNFAEFSSDGMRILTASDDGSARVWDASTGEPVSPRMRHQHWVFRAKFSHDDSKVVTSSWDGTARVWVPA